MRDMRPPIIPLITLAAAVIIGCALWACLSRISSLESAASQTTASVRALREDLAKAATARSSPATMPTPLPEAQIEELVDAVTLHSLKEAHDAVSAVKAKKDILGTATTLADFDTWDIAPGDQHAFSDLKAQLALQLRSDIRSKVIELQQAALAAPNGTSAAAKHTEAGEALALYPMSQEKSVLEEAKQLSNRQVDVAMRIEVIRRQRYNLWAAQQIEYAINDFNAKQSYWSPKKENGRLIDSMVTHLGPVDPIILEPTVLELYNYIIQRTKDSISEGDKTSLAKRLSDPAVHRHTLGDH